MNSGASFPSAVQAAVNSKRSKWAAGFLAVCALGLAAPCPAHAAVPALLNGALEGLVTDVSGRPQMGASVALFNKQDRLLGRVLTDERGNFAFASLVPDFYSVRVSLASFLPAIRDHILVQAGNRSLLDVNLSSLFSSIQVLPPQAGGGRLISSDWKYVLQTSGATRPVLRFLPDLAGTTRVGSPVFSDTHGVVRVSGGGLGTAGAGDAADLGTAFAFATSVLGSNELSFVGNLNYRSVAGLPSGGFRASFTRDLAGGSPEVTVTMRQIFIPHRDGFSLLAGLGTDLGAPLRTLSLSYADRTQITDDLQLQYGVDLDSVSLGERLHYFSPYARLSYALPSGNIDLTYTAGNARPDLNRSSVAGEDELEHHLDALAFLPRLSVRGGRTRVQRGENYELGYTRRFGSREFRIAGYRESVTDATLMTASTDGTIFPSDLLPDLYGNGNIFNAGDYESLGYTISGTQNIGDNFRVTLFYGSVGMLIPQENIGAAETPDDLRAMIREGRKKAVTLRGAGTIPLTGTNFVASYQWTDYHSATPGHLYSTRPTRPEPGLNIYVRQPVPQILGLPFRMEITADLRNLLAQGYLPISLTDGRQLLLVQTPRSFRGGVSFSF